MRVISGSAKSLKLMTVEGSSTRPTTDRIKETLFNMINNDIYDCVFLDLFAGSGSIGIEALSRGAAGAYFVDSSRACINVIKENLLHTHLCAGAVVMQMGYEEAIKNFVRNKTCFDIIFMDPPYNKNYERIALENIAGREILAKDGYVIVEAALDTDFSYAVEIGFNIVREKIYKTNKHIFLAEKMFRH